MTTMTRQTTTRPTTQWMNYNSSRQMNSNMIGAIPEIGTAKPLPGKQHVYGIKNRGVIGRAYQAKCPECGTAVLIIHKDDKPLKTKCRRCNAIIVSRGRNDAQMLPIDDKGQNTPPAPEKRPTMPAQHTTPQEKQAETGTSHTLKVKMGKGLEGKARLVWGNLFNRKKYVLHDGENIIGRRDKDQPSDLMFDDAYVSRRSVMIEKRKAAKGHFYKLTVLRISNPVLVNGEELQTGDNVYLNFGDTIAMGYNTVLTFKGE